MITVRVLQESDAEDVRRVRLQAIQEHPEAFGASYDEDASLDISVWQDRLRNGLPNNVSFGAFIDDELVGICHLGRYNRMKSHHRFALTGMYMASTARGQGAGQALVEAAIAYARELGDVEQIILAVTVGNDPAKRLYERTGFTTWGLDRHYLKIDGHYFDLEWMTLDL